MAQYKALASDLSSQIGNANKGFGNQNRLLEQQTKLNEKRIAQEKKLEKLVDSTARKQIRAKKIRSGAAAGGGVAAASALGNVPILGDAATGGLVAGLSGASVVAGAVAGAVVGLGSAIAEYSKNAAIAAAETQRFRQALQGVTFGNDYATALESINQLSDQFVQDIGETTKQFTKLTAATTANGLSIEDTTDVYKGLAAANLALGGDAERLNGILLATQQVFSKGKVQAEELRGQIGERLPGAFALFAQSMNKTPAQLDDLLEKGKVTVEDFVNFTRLLFKRFEEDAQRIADGPANAGARLEKALGDLQRNIGTLLQPVGAMFQNVFTGIVEVINQATLALNSFLGIGLEGAISKVEREINGTFQELERRRQAEKEGRGYGRGGRAANLREIGILEKRMKRLYKEYFELQSKVKGNAPTPPTKPPEAKTEVEDKIKKTAKIRAEDVFTDESLRELRTRISSAVLDIDREITQALEAGDKVRAKQLENEKALLPLKMEIQQIEGALAGIDQFRAAQAARKADAADTEARIRQVELLLTERKNELETVQEEIKRDQIRDNEELLEQEKALLKAKEDALRPLEDQRKLLEAKLNGNEEAVRLEIEAANIARDIQGLTKEEVLEILKRNDALQKQVETMEQLKQQQQEIATGIASAFTNAFRSVIDGSKEVQEAFSDMMKDIADTFLDQAMRMIQSAITQQLLQLIPMLFGPTGATPAGRPLLAPLTQGPAAGNVLTNFLSGRADGGPVMSNQPYLVGERGPEIVIPNTSGSVVTNDRSRALMDNQGSRAASMAMASAPINISYDGPSLVFDNRQFIARDELPRIVNEASQAGERRTLARLKNSRASRANLGL